MSIRMKRTVPMMFLFLLLCCARERNDTCGVKICFTWTVSEDRLTLTCKVGSLHFWVKIKDPFGKIRAQCLIAKKTCQSFFGNESISQNIKTNETVFVLNGKIDQRVNGTWECLHGTKLELGLVDVTVLDRKGVNTMSQNDICKVVIAILAVCLVVMIILIICMQYCSKKCTELYHKLRVNYL